MVDVMITTLMDEYKDSLMKIFKRKEIFVLFVCVISFLIGIPCVLQVRNVFVERVAVKHVYVNLCQSKKDVFV